MSIFTNELKTDELTIRLAVAPCRVVACLVMRSNIIIIIFTFYSTNSQNLWECHKMNHIIVTDVGGEFR